MALLSFAWNYRRWFQTQYSVFFPANRTLTNIWRPWSSLAHIIYTMQNEQCLYEYSLISPQTIISENTENSQCIILKQNHQCSIRNKNKMTMIQTWLYSVNFTCIVYSKFLVILLLQRNWIQAFHCLQEEVRRGIEICIHRSTWENRLSF